MQVGKNKKISSTELAYGRLWVAAAVQELEVAPNSLTPLALSLFTYRPDTAQQRHDPRPVNPRGLLAYSLDHVVSRVAPPGIILTLLIEN